MDKLTYSYKTPDKKDFYFVMTNTENHCIKVFLKIQNENLLQSVIKYGTAYVPVRNSCFMNKTINYEIYDVLVDSDLIDYVVFSYNKNLYKIPYKDFKTKSTTDSPAYHIFRKRYLPIHSIKEYLLNF